MAHNDFFFSFPASHSPLSTNSFLHFPPHPFTIHQTELEKLLADVTAQVRDETKAIEDASKQIEAVMSGGANKEEFEGLKSKLSSIVRRS